MANYINRQKPNSGLANFLANKGRFGDTELVHMTRPELKRLENTGLMTLNPQTGLPEMFLGGIFKGLKNYAKNMVKPKNFIPALASMFMPAALGSIANASPFGQVFSPGAIDAMLKGTGTFLGNVPFRGFKESAQAGLTHAGADYAMGLATGMFRPGPDSYGLPSKSEQNAAIGKILLDNPPLPSRADFYSDPANTDTGTYDQLLKASQARQAILNKWQGTPNFLGGGPNANVGRMYSKAPGSIQKLVGGDKLATFSDIHSDLFNVGLPQEPQPWEVSRLAPTPEGKIALMQAAASARGKVMSRAELARGHDPWRAFKNEGLQQLQEGFTNRDLGQFSEGLQTLPVMEMLGSAAGSMEATSLTDAMKAQEDFEDEEKARLEKSQFAGYTPSRSNVRYSTRRLANPLGSIPTRRVEEGGLVGLAYGGNPKRDFEGMVQGGGHGMQDNVLMDIKQKGGLLAVSPKEYVVPADVMSMIGNGNPDNGAKQMDGFISDFRKKKYGRDRQPPEMNGRTALQSLLV